MLLSVSMARRSSPPLKCVSLLGGEPVHPSEDPPGHGAMIGQEHGLAVCEVRLQHVARRRSAGGGVGDHWHFAHQQGDFGEYVAGYRPTHDREGRGGRRMGVDDRAAVGPAPVDPEVEI